MCVVKKLLAEKLIDDFYEEYARTEEKESPHEGNLMESLKALLAVNHHDLLYRWEAQCAENGGRELRQFADFVAWILMTAHRHEEGDGA